MNKENFERKSKMGITRQRRSENNLERKDE